LQKQFTQDYNMITNWDEQIDLLSEQFETQTAYNALNSPISIIHPDNAIYAKSTSDLTVDSETLRTLLIEAANKLYDKGFLN